MSDTSRLRKLVLNASAALSVILPSPMLAQSAAAQASKPASAPAAAPAGADMTTATFGDWQMQCRSATPGPRACELLQSVVVQGQTAPFAQIGVGRIAPGEPLYFTAVLPTNVTFPSVVRVSLDEKDAQPVEVVWTRCLQGGCFASVALKDEVLKKWRTHDGPARLVFKNGAAQESVVPISFRGLARALDALAAQAGLEVPGN